ncbi:sigma-70 family RNA polymerase sigma factor [Undibacterium arcticum]|uniref:RNA polymerase sigma factor n=1 Tax=Undibacterium arcticum TaxID=1762892 RepID=A0ABV7F988_9BURK
MTDQERSQRFQDTMLPHLHAAYNLARWLTRSDGDAQDVVQEAYLRAFRYFDAFHGHDGRSWLLAIVRNTYYSGAKQHEHELREVQFDEDHLSADEIAEIHAHFGGDNDPAAILQRGDESRRVHRALERVPTAFREVLILRELEDLSYREIADIAGIPVGTVMSRLARGRKLLAAYLLEREACHGL